ncbi:MAG: hypothetical protein O3C40_04010 [Planctomycetota bacterium]|nr:hypothetical protein [Planctomycetota bacterium]
MRVDGASKLNGQPMRMPLRAIAVLAMIAAIGCGTTKTRLATDQLLVSDAVDQAVGDIDFGVMAGQKVYFDAQYIKNIKGVGFVNSEYIISSLRQQMAAADCRLQDAEDDADFVVEARVGTLGTNGHEIVYGVPANNSLSTAANLMPNAPSIPTIPELALAKKDAHLGAAKIAVFAYERESRRPVWQSGISRAKSTAQDFWFFGAGPFQRGSVYDGTQFAGIRIRLPRHDDDGTPTDALAVSYREQFHFPRSTVSRPMPEIATVGHEEQLPPVVLPPARAPGSEPIPRQPQPREQPTPAPQQPPPPTIDQ